MTSMKINVVRRAVYMLALGLSLVPASAVADTEPRVMQGKFQLTSETRLETAVLPPGSYSLSVEDLGPYAIMRVSNEKHVVAAFICHEHPGTSISRQDFLTVERNGAESVIRSLDLRELGVVISFSNSKATPVRSADRTLP
jgi:hypothetical protein